MANIERILNRIPERLAPGVVFSEDEDSSCSQESSENEGKPVMKELLTTVKVNKRLPLKERKLSPRAKKEDSKTLVGMPFQCKSQSYNLEEIFADTMNRIKELKGLKASDETMPQASVRKSKLPISTDYKKRGIANAKPIRDQCAIESQSSTDKVFVINNNVYNVLSLLGSGASCKVYSAFNQCNKTIVAIKHVDLEKADSALIEGFKKEISYLKLLRSSDDVIKMYDYEQTRNEILIVLEKGDTDLASFLQDEKKKQNITPILIKFYWSQMLRAVSAIHKHNIIHSDLKPANFLLVAGHLKLIDFGIAASIPNDSTSIIRDNLVGTVNYMSPEAVQTYFSTTNAGTEQQYGSKVSVKADVWSLGCILYNLVHGHTPFQHMRRPYEKISAITSPEYEIPFPPINNAALTDVLKSCLMRNPKERASVTELLNHSYLTNEERPIMKRNTLRNELVSQIQILTPNRMKHVTQIINKLANERNVNEK